MKQSGLHGGVKLVVKQALTIVVNCWVACAVISFKAMKRKPQHNKRHKAPLNHSMVPPLTAEDLNTNELRFLKEGPLDKDTLLTPPKYISADPIPSPSQEDRGRAIPKRFVPVGPGSKLETL
jgi:hypothetical protein